MKLNLHLPINSTSFGQTSTLILRTLFDEIKQGKRLDEDFSVCSIGQVDTRTQQLPDDFSAWLNSKLANGIAKHSRKTPTFKLWHLNGGIESLSEKQTLLSFYELDEPTEAELNVARNNKTLFSSRYSIEKFTELGVDCSHIPLAFDDYNFKDTNKKYFNDGRVTFSVCGKFEKRKNHEKVIKSWIKKFKNDKRYSLQCCIYNPFMDPAANNNLINGMLNSDKPFNVNFLPFLEKNSTYNDFLNSSDIVLGMSGGEGWGLPEFTSVCIGKHSVIMNAHSYKEWANESNSTLTQPYGKKEAYDGVFFHKNTQFNQGNIFDFNEDAFIASCETAIQKLEKDKINKEGLKTKDLFTKESLLDNIVKYATS